MRRLLLAGLLLGCAPRPKAHDARPSTAASAAPVVVAVVIDQQAAWLAAERWPTLPATGGVARLRREGTWLRDVRYAHAACDTAPGHASIHTGLTPRETGIVSNERVEDGKVVPFLRESSHRLVDERGPTSAPGASIVRLRVDTLADRLRAARPDAQIVSVSLKDRAAIFGGGRAPDATLWFDPGSERFVTSTAFASSLPTWARPLAGPDAMRALRARPWTLLDAPYVVAHASADDGPGEGDLAGLGRTFPHEIPNATAFRATPAADDAVLALATAALRARDRARPMLLSISLSAHDYVGHVFGQDSFEAWDELARLDVALARLLATLDDAETPSGWSLVLTGDHGAAPLPESTRRPWCAGGAADRWERPCEAGHRIDATELRAALDSAAAEVLGPGRWVEGVVDPWVVYGDAARALPPERLDALDAAVLRTVLARPGVATALSRRRLPAACPLDDTVPGLVCRSTSPSVPFDVYVVSKPGSFFDTGYVPGHGSNHGSPWLFDRSVPLVVRAPGRVDAGVERDEPTSFATTTRALAALLDLPADPRWVGLDVVRARGRR